ncbi:MAG: hypothetical protein J0M25_06190 [Flavobacteriales bacterium]|nr:hypothetical protein [Flavobacteriales bacterium]
MDEKELNKVGIKMMLLIFFIAILFSIKQNYSDKELKKNEIYSIGEITKIYYGRGNRTVDFTYYIYGIEYKSKTSSFTQKINKIGSKYFVIINKYNYEQAYILGCCPYDESKHFVPLEGLDKIPDKALQKKADEAFEEIFNSPLGRLLPPY